ncbi:MULTISPECIES: hypothetical protein [unclassified Pseudomonas]|uniref:hypothetical protein n=1 Tax=unclassified Pseudomonas TaxID=196821 RepID=UPI000A1D7ECD|nr:MULTISPECIES: hypothetical protein [unclassified Pseudomonas]POA52086.1 hypothetical protein C1889_24120 [Pseudomonas sp. FW507-12TSA]
MSIDRIFHLEQALLAVITQAAQQGLESEKLCSHAIGGMMGNTSWRWVTAEYVPGAADELESALRVLKR